MTFALGVFELFTYAIPGSMLLGVLTYAAVRLQWLNLETASTIPGPLQFAIVAIGSYLLGHLTYLGGVYIDRMGRFGFRRDARDAWAAVSTDATSAGIRPVPYANVMLMLAAVQLQDKDAANDISRFRATGLMLRNVTIPVLLAALLAVAEVVRGPHRALAGVIAALLALAALGFLRVGQRLRYWANTKTYQLACWLDLPNIRHAPEMAIDGQAAAQADGSSGSGSAARPARSTTPAKP